MVSGFIFSCFRHSAQKSTLMRRQHAGLNTASITKCTRLREAPARQKSCACVAGKKVSAAPMNLARPSVPLAYTVWLTVDSRRRLLSPRARKRKVCRQVEHSQG